MLRGGDAWKNRGSVLNQCSVLLRHPLVFHERERVTNNTNYEAGMGAQVYPGVQTHMQGWVQWAGVARTRGAHRSRGPLGEMVSRLNQVISLPGSSSGQRASLGLYCARLQAE